ncbi:MAG: hypothetical protein GTN53_28430 [Candidatus Aminicenantes bacterium]|nr:hypothetical protein [Candidatus Aminicenantes bacterium]NIQ70398.1 hypothetical protein [Candidatus Aminicenantes bacterium]NIT26442.1 hypothetical protein [Candidatus Aminicenantes bacterium]
MDKKFGGLMIDYKQFYSKNAAGIKKISNKGIAEVDQQTGYYLFWW